MINMREKDQSKKAKIIQAVFEIVDRDGLAGLSFGKIAKWAGISSGTPYVYYRDKTDMLSQIYVATKQQLESGLDEQLAQTDSTKEQLITCLEYFARQYIKYPLQANYIMAIHAAPELITPTARQAGRRHVYQQSERTILPSVQRKSSSSRWRPVSGWRPAAGTNHVAFASGKAQQYASRRCTDQKSRPHFG